MSGLFKGGWTGYLPPTPERSLPLVPDPHQRLIATARQYLKVRETDGPNRSPDIDRFVAYMEGKPTGEAWCADYVCYCVHQVEQDLDRRSPLIKTASCQHLWRANPTLQVSVAFPGFLIVWELPSTDHGHVGIVTGIDPTGTVRTIEGNTDQEGSREGDGVYEKTWPRTSRLRLLGYLDPWGKGGTA